MYSTTTRCFRMLHWARNVLRSSLTLLCPVFLALAGLGATGGGPGVVHLTGNDGKGRTLRLGATAAVAFCGANNK